MGQEPCPSELIDTPWYNKTEQHQHINPKSRQVFNEYYYSTIFYDFDSLQHILVSSSFYGSLQLSLGQWVSGSLLTPPTIIQQCFIILSYSLEQSMSN
jgi:hypothetical protein